ncbi:serine/threonine-protein kinase [Fimbriiglobus ruber]|uniref:Serine/threonine protein kinase n=1 Tax=Fimbriiglobus ruber TaxID=1908690 RepID=A0A225DZN0_9BACT|nr:serine/threonine-protein kinase [Fimbriiglobus ruber]OWK46801.1 serine/threonine protein kinase [Fimbriiglobus ruber]
MPHRQLCPDATEFESLLLNRVTEDRAAALEAHVGLCPICQRVVDGLTANLRLSTAIRGMPRTPVPPPPAVLGELAARLGDLTSQFTRVEWTHAGPDGGADHDDELPGFAPPAANDEVGRLGPYRVLRLLGAGGMGLVYLAEDTALRRPVAIKILRPRLARRRRARDGFLSEARAMAALKHDNIVTVFQIGETPGGGGESVPYLAMELLDGESLADWVRREGRMPVEWAARLGRQAAEGLAVAHARGVIHRDIKPGNLWLEAPPGWADTPGDRRPPLPAVARLKILDFGLAQPVGEAEGGDGPGFGTPAYMPPEQMRGERTSPAADLFSLGVVLYELTTGGLPFPIRRQSVVPEFRTPPDLRDFVPTAPAAFAALVHQLLALAPADRPASANGVATELFAATAPVADTLVDRPDRTVELHPGRVRHRRLVRVGSGAAIGIAIAVLAAGGTWLAARSGDPTGPGPAAGAILPGPPDDDWCQAVATLPAERQAATVIDKLRELNPGYDGEASLRYRSGQVSELIISTDTVRDIRPIRALKGLRHLECNGSGLGRGLLIDLSPIKGLNLEVLNAWWNPKLTDFNPVRGMKLRSCQIGETPVEDLSPFQGMPLTFLSINGCRVRDIAVVRTLPKLEFLRCDGCPIESLNPLAESTVKRLVFDFRRERGDADILSRIPWLTHLNYRPANEFRRSNGLSLTTS